MDKPNRNAWNARTGYDTLFNGALIATGIVGVLLTLLGASDVTSSLLAFAFA